MVLIIQMLISQLLQSSPSQYLKQIPLPPSQFHSSKHNKNSNKLQISYTPMNLILSPVSTSLCQTITNLHLPFCQMQSLAGIEQFVNLQELNIRQNNITEVKQLQRISNKSKLKVLDISGNDIQYYEHGLFINLQRNLFAGLIQLNGKNYSYIFSGKGNPKQMICLKKLISQTTSVGNSIRKILHQEHRKNLNQEHRREIANRNQKLAKNMIATTNQGDQYEVEGQESRRRGYAEEYDGEDYEEQGSYQERENIEDDKIFKRTVQKSRFQQYSQSYNQESQYNQPNQYDKQDKQNYPNQNVLQDVSLGAISNIPMTKSIRASINDHAKSNGQKDHSFVLNHKKKGLQINTFNESSLENCQINALPTATFAMQRKLMESQEVQGKNIIQFRNTDAQKIHYEYQKTQKYNKMTEPIEQLEDSAISNHPTRRSIALQNNNYKSICQILDNSMSEYDENSLMMESRLNIQRKKDELAETLHLRKLFDKAMIGFAMCVNEKKDRPMKRHFQFN